MLVVSTRNIVAADAGNAHSEAKSQPLEAI